MILMNNNNYNYNKENKTLLAIIKIKIKSKIIFSTNIAMIDTKIKIINKMKNFKFMTTSQNKTIK